MVKSKNTWLLYAVLVTVFWGVWGATTELSKLPGTIIYIIWSTTMIIPAIIALKNINWKLEKDTRSIYLGVIIGFTGAGGQMVLFTGAIENGPAYLIFPIISLSPIITILLSLFFLKEKASKKGWFGILFAIAAIPFLSYQDANNGANGYLWLIYALLVFLAWGFQAFVMKKANNTMKAESIFFYMMLTGILLSPIAYFMTDFSQNIELNIANTSITFGIQILNSIGALMLVYAFRYGKAIIVSPLTNAVAPVITVILSLIIYQIVPHKMIIIGMLMAVISIFLLAFEDE
ncbi:MAG: EamA family transporter [Bacteroidetes bacterium]|nr:MAG: EamA family transporter [Bacteroidota bacterium]